MKKYLLATLVLFISMINLYAEEPAAAATDEVKAGGKYPLTVCPISGETLGEMGDPIVKVYDGREVKFCCKNCVAPFEKKLSKSMEILDEKIIAANEAAYPIKTCVVSGEPLTEKGAPVKYVYLNTLVEFCCKNCIADFKKDPDKYLAMLNTPAVPADSTVQTKE